MDEYTYQTHHKFIEKFGKDGTIMSLFEEVGELMTAISHYKRGRIPVADVISEIADVKIALDSMLVLYDTSMQFNVPSPISSGIYHKKFNRFRKLSEE